MKKYKTVLLLIYLMIMACILSTGLSLMSNKSTVDVVIGVAISIASVCASYEVIVAYILSFKPKEEEACLKDSL